jgi:uncharacterized membrane protein
MRLFPITIDVDKITSEMLDWAILQNARVDDDNNITFSNSKKSTKTRLHFNYTEKSSALLFLLIFDSHVVSHNMKELEGVKSLYDTA